MRHPIAFLVALPTLLISQPSNELNFLTNHVDGREIKEMLPRYLKAKAFRLLDERRNTVSAISSAQNLEARRKMIRERLARELGGLPERTPLNARTVATLDFDAYRIEKVIFESQPGFPVTANLYLPKTGRAPHPAILFPLGHEQGAKAHDAWQHVLVTFARRGYVCLAWDTIGQGERIQIWDDDLLESKVIRSTTEHTMVGLQTLLVGDQLARYTIWDGIRALDYLLSRPEVDSTRVGVTGNSGGGTHTAYLAALDDRFAAAAPSCYITGWRRLLETIGPQDAEQCIPPSIGDGLDHGDFILAFAPKPYLMLTALRDFFSIEGARETASEAARIYDSIGAGAKFGRFEYDDGHGYSKPRREAAYRFFSKYLAGAEDSTPEAEVKILSEPQLWCTRTGQVATSLNPETVFTLNQKRLAQVKRPGATLDTARQFTVFAPRTGPVPVKGYGVLERNGYRIERLSYESEPGIQIPALLYLPSQSGKRPAAVVAFGGGKSSAHSRGEELVRGGSVVLSVDLRGVGETRAAGERNGSDFPRYFGDYESSMTALLAGKPLATMRAEDIARAVDLLLSRPEVDPANISVNGRDSAAIPSLMAAAFDTRIAAVTLERMIPSWQSVTAHRIHRQQWENAIVGVLRHFDLGDLIRWTAPRTVKVIDPVNPLGQPMPAL